MQSTSVDVVSVKPAAGAEVPGQALYSAALAGATGVVATAAEAGDTESAGTSAAITAIAVSTPKRFLKLENIVSSMWVSGSCEV
jgi:hypothetical protein